jgi:hypothetical protein
MYAVKGLFMEKWLCWASIGLAGLLLVLFLLDIVMDTPFGGVNWTVDVFGILAGGVALWLAINAYRDLR